MRPHLVRDGAITLGVGLIFTAVGTDGLAAFNACLADSACLAYSSTMNLPGFLGLLVAGITVSVAGIVALAIGLSHDLKPWPDPLV